MRRSGRGDRILTCDLLVPNQALYQAKLHPGQRHAAITTLLWAAHAEFLRTRRLSSLSAAISENRLSKSDFQMTFRVSFRLSAGP